MDSKQLYQEVILDHNKHPRNFGKLQEANAVAHGVNPLCGDHFDIYVSNVDGTIRKIQFELEQHQ